MRAMFAWGLLVAGALVFEATGVASLDAQQAGAGAGATAERYAPGARVLVDAHNAYPYDGKFGDRIERALRTGLPLAIEQDLVWYTDPATGKGRSVVSHGGPDAATAPTFEEYFFTTVKPIMEQALATPASSPSRADWPLIVLNLDFKTNEPAHHAAVWALLGTHEAWLTTAERTADGKTPAPLKVGPMLVLTGGNNAQQTTFHDQVPVGQRLRLFGAIEGAREPELSAPAAATPGTPRPRPTEAQVRERALQYAQTAVDTLIPPQRTNYRRWVNFSWGVVEAGGAGFAEDWTPAEADRLRALVARAHAQQLWIRFYTLNGHPQENGMGWGRFYNFGSAEAAAPRWKAAIEAGTDFVATDMYEDVAKLRAELTTKTQPKTSAAR